MEFLFPTTKVENPQMGLFFRSLSGSLKQLRFRSSGLTPIYSDFRTCARRGTETGFWEVGDGNGPAE
jgi:hypothetical protein